MQPAAPAPYQAGADVGGFVSTWLKVWVAILGVVTLVVVVFLVAITQTLAAINGNLATAQNAVVDVGGETKTLPRQVDNVNASLVDIDEDVKPIQSGAQRIVSSLRSIQGKLANVDRSLGSTSGVLTTVGGQAGDVQSTLAAAQAPGSEGTNLIWRQVGGSPGSLGAGDTVNGNLVPIHNDAVNAIGQLQRTNASLQRICSHLVLRTLGCA